MRGRSFLPRIVFLLILISAAGLSPAISRANSFQLQHHMYPAADNPFASVLFKRPATTGDPVFFVLEPREWEINVTESDSLITMEYRDPVTQARWFRILTPYDYYQLKLRYLAQEGVLNKLMRSRDQVQRSSGGAVQIDIPFKVKNRAFRRFFGSGRIGLNATGNINVLGGFRNEKRQHEESYSNRNSNTSFNMDMQQRFTVSGHIGDKVEVNIDQDTDNTFDWENSLKITYTGSEDEIIKTIEAGNVSLTLPGSNFVTFSGRNQGLFGLKAVTQFGPLNVTGIMSVERGQNQAMSFTGSQQEQTTSIGVNDFIKDRFFFVHSQYRDQYNYYDDHWTHLVDYNKKITYTQLFVSDPASSDTLDLFEASGEQVYENLLMRELTLNQDYSIDFNLGILTLNRRLAASRVLGIRFLTDENGGTSYPIGGENDDLLILRDNQEDPDAGHWSLMLRNVYQAAMPADRESEQDVDMVIRRLVAGSSDPDHQSNVPYIRLFHLDNENSAGALQSDGRLDSRWIESESGLLFFPTVEPFGLGTDATVFQYTGGELVEYPTEFDLADTLDWIYHLPTTDLDFDHLGNLLYLESSVMTLSRVYNLGWNVIEGSESVKLNGVKLNRDTDYTIDYMSGTLTLITPDADNPGSSLEINYQSHDMMIAKKKTIVGVRGEYDLGDDSYIGATVLYLNEQTQEDKVRIGNEPMSNLVLDLNGSLKFRPRWLTRAVDIIPLVEAVDPSEIQLEGEVAQVLPDPNPLNNPATGDNSGVAYVDDFESAKREQDLGMRPGNWFPSSQPLQMMLGERGVITAWSPVTRVPRKQIWENYDSGNQTNDDMQVLRLDFYPMAAASGSGSEGEPLPTTSSWAGLYNDFLGANPDQTNTKFIELMVNTSGDQSGRIHIDLGEISEDFFANGDLDTEDEIDPGTGFPNLRLDTGENGGINEDIGIDHMDLPDPPWPLPDSLRGYISDNPAYDWYDINNNGRKDALEPWSYDDFKAVNSGSETDAMWYKGMQGNGEDSSYGYPDTEDRDGDGILDTDNNYFSYIISTDPASPWSEYQVAPANEYGWRLIRIPLDEFSETVGSPSFRSVRGVRVWMEGYREPTSLYLASFALVGNEWVEQYPVVAGDTLVYGDVSVINTHENPLYDAPPGVRGMRDAITQAIQKEQSLVIALDDLPYDSTFWTEKLLNEPVKLMEYNRLRMFVHGGSQEGVGEFPDNGELELRFRLMTTSTDYYEYRRVLQEGWDDNNVDIVFEEVTDLEPFERATRDLEEPEKPRQLGDGGFMFAVGNPSMNDVRIMMIGVHNHGQHPVTTEVYCDELRVSDIKKEAGYAQRASLTVRLSDFMTLSGRLEHRDSEFHTVEQRMGTGDNSTQYSLNSTVHLDKFLPRPWNVQLPMAVSHTQTVSSPKYYPGDDRLVGNNPPEEVLRRNVRSTGSLNFSKTNSESPWLTQTLDKMRLGYDVSRVVSSNDQILGDTTRSENISVNYSNSIQWDHDLKPLFWLKPVPLIGRVHDLGLHYMPRNLEFGATSDWSSSHRHNRNSTYTENNTHNLNRNSRITLQPFRSLSFSWNRRWQGNLRFKRSDLYEESDSTTWQFENASTSLWDQDKTIQQTMTFNWKVPHMNWIAPDLSYSSQYSWSRILAEPRKGVNLANDNSLSGSGTLKTEEMLNWLFHMPKTSGRSRDRNRSRRGGEVSSDTAAVADTTSAPGFSFMNLALASRQGAFNVLNRFGNIRITTSLRRNRTDPGMDIYDEPLGSRWRHGSLLYQLGLNDDPGSGIHSLGNSTNFNFLSSSSLTRSLGLTSQFKVTSSINSDLSYQQEQTRGWGERESRRESRNELLLYFLTSNEVGFTQEAPAIIFPDYSFRISKLEKAPVLNRFCQSVTLNHQYHGNTEWEYQDQGDALNLYRVQYERNFTPLTGINITWKKPFSTNISYNLRNQVQLTYPGEQRDVSYSLNSDINVTTTYRLPRGKKLPFKIPFVKMSKLKNEASVDLTYTKSRASNRNSNNGLPEWSQDNFNKSWTLKFQLNYQFSANVTGSMSYEFGQRLNYSDPYGRVDFSELRINVNTNIRGH